MSADQALLLLGIAAIVATIFGWIRYRDPVNPLTATAISQIGVFTLFSGFVAIRLDPFGQVNQAAAVQTALISIVYLAGITTPYLFRGGGPAAFFGRVLALVRLDSPQLARHFDPVRLALICGAGAIAFGLLAVIGGGGMLWITESRTAYQFHRAGAGPFFALSQWLFTFALLYVLWSLRPRTLGVVVAVAVFSVPMLFLGSKGFVLTQVIAGALYRHFMVRRIPTAVFTVAAPLLLVAQMALQLYQGTAATLLDTALYFRDYFATTAQFIGRFDEFGYHYGRALVSELWFFVPRALYPDKPYEYGALLIHRVLFPGLAATSHTPGLLLWSAAYLDFGVAGVYVSGVAAGVGQRMAYEYFLAHRDRFFAFALMAHVGIWHIWLFAPLPVTVVLTLLQALALRLVLVARSPSARAPTSGHPVSALPDRA